MQNFGKIKNAFNGILVENMVLKNDANKLLFQKYIQTIKENKVLKTQFLVYDNIENKIEENEFKATQFVQANIDLLNKFTKKEIHEANANLARPILFEQGESKYSKDKLHEDITKLIFTEKTPKTLDSILEATARIVDYIKSNKKLELTEAINLPSSMLTTMMVDKYNEKYSSLDESEKQILKVLIDSTAEQKKIVYSKTIRECIDLINEKLKGSDLDAKDKLLRVKDKLLNDKLEINEDFEKNISKLIELKDSLNNN
jgi:hypothetical protein